MSICRIVFRFEIADSCRNTLDLFYKAKEGEDKASLSEVQSLLRDNKLPVRSSYAAVTSGVGLFATATRLSKPEVEIYKGRREYQLISVHTYIVCTSSVDQNDTDNMMTTADNVDQVTDLSAKTESTEILKPAPTSSPPIVVVDDVTGDRVTSSCGVNTGNVATDSEASKPSGVASRPHGAMNKAVSPPPGTSAIRFVSGNPLVELTEGILHLFKEDQLTPLTDSVLRSEMICIMNVPATLTSQDLLQFLAPLQYGLVHVKIIRGYTPNEYMVLLKFRAQVYADEFFREYNNHPFNSIEPEICRLAYVARVEAVRASEGGGLTIPGVTELPNCAVCLERMDESVDGVLTTITVLCNHSFHGACLAEWNDTSCPVCRYVQTPVAVADNKCFQCSSQENLWICLICGVVGCGRYDAGHAYAHFKETSHTYSMQLGSNRVWDYAGDNYVHRLIQNKTDGKLVQFDEGGNPAQEEKVDSLALEYTYLLTSQLETQRYCFEQKLQVIEKHKDRQIEDLEGQIKKVIEDSVTKEQLLAGAIKDKLTFEKRCNLLQMKVQKLTTDVSDEREMNRGLRENQTVWQAKVSELTERLNKKDEEMSELQDQLRDVMFFLEAKQTLSENHDVSQEEIQEGQIVVQPSPEGASGGGKKVRRRNR